jgi:predicted cytidylate kinase
MDKFNYRNITISGGVGSGTTTLSKLLKEKLEKSGWKFFNGGEFMRDYAIKNKLFDPKNQLHHEATVYSDDFDKKIDFGMKDRLQKENNLVLESWLSGFMAQGVEGVLKILLVCSDDAIRVDRVVNRDNSSVDAAKTHIFEREEKNFAKWKRLYGDHNFWDPKLYDLVIDTYKFSREETLGIVLYKLGYK